MYQECMDEIPLSEEDMRKMRIRDEIKELDKKVEELRWTDM